MEKKYIVAFELGSSCIKGAVATVDPTSASGRINVVAVESQPLVDKIKYGCVENPGDVASCITALCNRLQATQGVTPRVIREAYVGISGRSMGSISHVISRDFHTEIEITQRVINDLMSQAANRVLSDKEIVAIEPGTFSVNSQSLSNPVGMLGQSIQANVSLIACKPKIRNNIKRVFNERCAINIAGYVVTPLALGAQLLSVEERRLGVMLVDFGAETTTVAIYREAALIYLATIPMGSRNITRDITSLNCLEERAEEIKKAVGNAMPPEHDGTPLVTDGLDNSEINSIVAARADEIISNIYEQINYAGLKPRDIPAGIVVTGGGTKLRGFNDLLSKQSHMKVRQATLGPGVSIDGVGFNVNDSLDVIAILADAAMNNPVECTQMPPQMVDDNVMNDNAGKTPDNSADENEFDDVSRIGLYDDDRDDDDHILEDDEDPNDQPLYREGIDKGRTKPSKGTAKDKKQAPKTDADDDKASRNRGFWERIYKRLDNMLQDEGEMEN